MSEEKGTETIGKEAKSSKKKSSILAILIVIVVAATLILLATGKIKIEKTVPDNYAPEITYHYDTNLNSLKGNVTLVVGVEDSDGDKVDVQFWVRENASNNWTGIGNFEGYNGTYQVKTNYINNNSGINLKTCYWKVDVTDYKTKTTGEYSFKFTGKRNA